jgi:hypothetical protein
MFVSSAALVMTGIVVGVWYSFVRSGARRRAALDAYAEREIARSQRPDVS